VYLFSAHSLTGQKKLGDQRACLYQMTAAAAQGQSPVAPVAADTMAAASSSLTLPALSVTTIDIH